MVSSCKCEVTTICQSILQTALQGACIFATATHGFTKYGRELILTTCIHAKCVFRICLSVLYTSSKRAAPSHASFRLEELSLPVPRNYLDHPPFVLCSGSLPSASQSSSPSVWLSYIASAGPFSQSCSMSLCLSPPPLPRASRPVDGNIHCEATRQQHLSKLTTHNSH